VRKMKYDIVETLIPGIKIRAVAGTKVAIPEKIIKKIHFLAGRFFKLKCKIEKNLKKLEKLKAELVKITLQNNGFRGIISEKEKFNLIVFPREKITGWDVDVLKKVLGPLYPQVVREEIKLTIILPKDGEMQEKVKKILIATGIPQELIEENIVYSIDEEKLKEISEKHKIPENMKISQMIWVVKVEKKI
jgi:hypothetical protein